MRRVRGPGIESERVRGGAAVVETPHPLRGKLTPQTEIGQRFLHRDRELGKRFRAGGADHADWQRFVRQGRIRFRQFRGTAKVASAPKITKAVRATKKLERICGVI